MDAELEELDAELEEFGKDALIKHVLAELELMRAMIELVRVEIAELKKPGNPFVVPGFNPSPSDWPPGTILCGTVQSSHTGGFKASQNINGAQMGQYSMQQSAASAHWDDHIAFASHLDDIIAESVEKVNKSREDLEEALAAIEA